MENQKDTNSYPTSNQTGRHQIELISKDNQAVFAYKKTERFSTAIYMVSNLMSDNEPLKWQLRTQAMSLMPIAGSLVMQDVSEKLSAIKRLTLSMIEILSLFEVAHKSQLMSDMNFKLLRKELVLFISEMSKPGVGGATSGVVFESDFFTIPHTESTSVIRTTSDVTKGADRVSVVKDNTFVRKTAVVSSPTTTIVSERRELMNNRKEAIIKIAREKNSPLMIKDFSYVIKDCSEKTIQRELSDLVDRGVLKKEGERRWSRYMLA